MRSDGRPVGRLAIAVNRSRNIPIGVRFTAPKKTLTCVRRQARKEVLFAKGKAGGGRISRRRRRNENSEVQC